MKEHYKYNIEWINFPESNRKIQGVYYIEHIYVGASTNVRARILHHLSCAFNYNKSKSQRLIREKYLQDGHIKVAFLSFDLMDEKRIYDILKAASMPTIEAIFL